jgi:hypothetical protein
MSTVPATTEPYHIRFIHVVSLIDQVYVYTFEIEPNLVESLSV